MSDTINFGIYNTLKWEELSTEYLHGLADMGYEEAQSQLKKIYSAPIETQKIGFGKFAGKMWIDLDIDYLYWILDNLDSNNIKAILANKALKYIQEFGTNDEFGDVIYVD